ncbi:MAG: helix-turn-helix transcriptional regulator [Caldilineaceae bacterium]
MSQLRGSVAGGQVLRRLRERLGWSQLDVAVETDVISQANYSKIESGKTQPSRKKLEEILVAFDAARLEQEAVLKFFGYLPEMPLPTQDEIEAVIIYSHTLLVTATGPAFLVDIGTRLIHWNPLYARLLGKEGHEILETMRGRPFMQMAFERKQELGDLVDDLDAVLLNEVATIRRRLEAFKQEAWVGPFIEEMAYDTPGLEDYWRKSEQEAEQLTPVTELPAKPPKPVRFHVPGIPAQPLSFYGYMQPVNAYPAFQCIFLLPSDAFTLTNIENRRSSDDTRR